MIYLKYKGLDYRIGWRYLPLKNLKSGKVEQRAVTICYIEYQVSDDYKVWKVVDATYTIKHPNDRPETDKGRKAALGMVLIGKQFDFRELAWKTYHSKIGPLSRKGA